jgi:NADH:ubiquinone oxidoreductase subunit 6 (subunit J)
MLTLVTAAAQKPYVNWDALGKIILVGLIGGVGVVLVFGVGLLALERFEGAKSIVKKGATGLVVAVSGGLCVAAVIFGIYAMANPSHTSSAPKKKTNASVVVVHRS